MNIRNFTLSLISLGAALATACAHEVWIEDTPEGRLVLRFAEYGGEYEKSPGALDSLSVPVIFTETEPGKGKFTDATRKSDHFLLGDIPAKASTHAELAFAVMGGGDKPARKPIFYARWQQADWKAGTPTLTFDIVPTATPGEARILFRGEPLADAKASAYVPGGDEIELTSDKNGVLRIPVEKPGFYLLVGKHQRESQKGFWAGRAYDTVSHNCSLAFRVTPKKP